MESKIKLRQPVAILAAIVMMSLGSLGCGTDCEGLCQDIVAACERAEVCEGLEGQGFTCDVDESCADACSDISDEELAVAEAGLAILVAALDAEGC